MFVVIYFFKVKEGHEAQFVEAWEGLTNLIYKYERSLGSRLHKEEQRNYIAYAQWPDKTTWEKSGDKLPPQAETYKTSMRSACYDIKTLYKLNVTSDLLKK